MKNNQTEMLEMLVAAKAIMQQAYSPYSKFKVGACIRTTNNQFFVGCNFENASYSLTTCAETSALAAMINKGEKEIAEVVIVATSELPCTPCGACRQRIREFAKGNIPIHMFGYSQQLTKTLDELLPYSFGPQLDTSP